MSSRAGWCPSDDVTAHAHSGLNPIASSAGAISGFDMNSFQTSPDRQFSITGGRQPPSGPEKEI